MSKLQLSLKKKWFDMTKAGIKTEDYREINEYWIKRFVRTEKEHKDIGEALCALRDGYSKEQVRSKYGVYLKEFDSNIMTLGYPKANDKERILTFEHKGIEIAMGNPEWGAESGEYYFVIKHGNLNN